MFWCTLSLMGVDKSCSFKACSMQGNPSSNICRRFSSSFRTWGFLSIRLCFPGKLDSRSKNISICRLVEGGHIVIPNKFPEFAIATAEPKPWLGCVPGRILCCKIGAAAVELAAVVAVARELVAATPALTTGALLLLVPTLLLLTPEDCRRQMSQEYSMDVPKQKSFFYWKCFGSSWSCFQNLCAFHLLESLIRGRWMHYLCWIQTD